MLGFIAAISFTVMQFVWITFCFGSFAAFWIKKKKKKLFWFLLLYICLFFH
jgi:hypothetical protein